MIIGYFSLAVLLVFLFGRRIHSAGHKKNKVVQVIDSMCARCRNCLKKCHHHVLDMVNDEKGSHLIVKYPDRCTGCGDCINTCKFNALELVDRVIK